MSRAKQSPTLILTCEHGGNRVPAEYRACFKGAKAALATHRGWDIGALAVARQLAREFDVPLHFATVTRLLCDLNRSIWHKRLFSEWSRDLDATTKERIIRTYYQPYRDSVEHRIEAIVERGRPVLHLSLHSFTPELDGHLRNCEIGLLYDPRRGSEARTADKLHAAIKGTGTSARVRRNYPYTGVSDGFQAYLRKRFPPSRYTAIEIEMNQGVVQKASGRRQMLAVLASAVRAACD